MTFLGTKTEITLDLLDEIGTTYSEGNENTAEPKGKSSKVEKINENKKKKLAECALQRDAH